MKFRTFPGTKWVNTGLRCERCDGKIFIEVEMRTGKRAKHFSCERSGCTWPDYHEDELWRRINE